MTVSSQKKLLHLVLSLLALPVVLSLFSCTTDQSSSEDTSNGSTVSQKQVELEYLGNEVCLECHDDGLGALPGSSHWMETDPRSPGAHENGCEDCHGPGEKHLDTDGDIDVPGMVTFGANANVPAEQQNRMCRDCHQSETRHWPGSLHDSDDIACTSCHTLLHGDQTQNKLREQTYCYDCHQNVRAEAWRPFHHPIREELLLCTDCHDPHGSPGPAQLRQISLNDNCYSCHAEKRGPYLWEHEPVVSDCNTCHSAHGSLHPALLKSRPPLLCQQCHQSTRINHSRQGFYFGKPPVQHTGGSGPGLRTGPEQLRTSSEGYGPADGTGSGTADGSFGPGQTSTGQTDSRDGFGPGDGTGTGEGGSSYGDGGHEGDQGDDQAVSSSDQDQSQDSDQHQDQDQDLHHDQDRLQEGPGGASSLVQGGSSRFLLGNSCLGCHPQVHGSNHPSGLNLMR